MARHAFVDLAQIFSLDPVNDAPDRLPRERYEQLYELLRKDGVKVCLDGQSFDRLREMRALYEGYALALSDYLRMPLPPWISDKRRRTTGRRWRSCAPRRRRRMRRRRVQSDSRRDAGNRWAGGRSSRVLRLFPIPFNILEGRPSRLS